MCAKFIAGNLVACHSSGDCDVAIIKSGNALMNGAQDQQQKKYTKYTQRSWKGKLFQRLEVLLWGVSSTKSHYVKGQLLMGHYPSRDLLSGSH